jgi:5-formyltetrahydrofolate cyclo-ligase
LLNPLIKAELRRSLLKARHSMPLEEWRQKSDRICNQLQASPLYASAQTILAYFSFRQEPDLSSLFTDTDRRWGFPRCVGNSLIWHIWKPGDFLQTGDYGILEPHRHAPTLQPTEVDLIFVPAVACDYQGYRLGYGGGYYDRLFSSDEWAIKPRIGIVFDFAYLSELPIDSWDKQLHGVCTETYLKMTL